MNVLLITSESGKTARLRLTAEGCVAGMGSSGSVSEPQANRSRGATLAAGGGAELLELALPRFAGSFFFSFFWFEAGLVELDAKISSSAQNGFCDQ